MKKTVCLVSEEYPKETNFGGISTYNKELATLLIRNGCKVIVLTRSLDKYKEYVEDGIHVIRIKTYFSKINLLEKLIGYRLAVYINIKKLLKKYNIDIIETPEWKAELLFFFLFNKYKKVPTVIRLHGCRGIIRKYDENDVSLADKIVILMEKYMLNKTKFVTSISKANLSETENVLNINIKNKTQIIYNFLDISLPKLKENENSKNKNILFIGRLDYWKGIFTISEVIPKILHKYDDTIFQFVGRDIYNNEKQEYNSKLILSNLSEEQKKRVEIVGQVEKKSVYKYYLNAYVTVLPSLFEPFGYTCIESMHQGTPVIASNNGGMSEIIDEGKDGFLIDPQNSEELYAKLCCILDNEELRSRMSKSAIDKIDRKFTNKVIFSDIEKYFDLIDS